MPWHAEWATRPAVGDERPSGQGRLVERLDVGQRETPRLALGEREPRRRVGETRLLLLALGGEEGGEPRQVLVERYQAMAIPPGAGIRSPACGGPFRPGRWKR